MGDYVTGWLGECVITLMWIISVLQPRVAVKTVVTINAPLALHSVPLDQIYTNQLYVWVIKYDVVICIMFHIKFIFFFIHVEFFFIQIVTHYHCTAGDLELRGFWLFPLNHRKIFRGYKSFCGFSQQLTPKSKEGIFCTLFFLWNPALRGVVTSRQGPFCLLIFQAKMNKSFLYIIVEIL